MRNDWWLQFIDALFFIPIAEQVNNFFNRCFLMLTQNMKSVQRNTFNLSMNVDYFLDTKLVEN